MNKKPVVQDDSREEKMAERFGLIREGGRIGIDATFPENKKIEVELKTTSKKSVSTARDLGPNHLAKWRRRYWLVEIWEKDKSDDEYKPTGGTYFLAPEHMEDWYKKLKRN